MRLDGQLLRDGVALRNKALERLVRRRLFDIQCEPPAKVVLWNGEAVPPVPARPCATLHVRDPWVLVEVAAGGELALGDAYVDGRVEVEGDLSGAIEAVFRERRPSFSWIEALGRLAAGILPSLANGRERARANVHHHYDLGNDFYARWLDERMLYTCAYFPTPDATLEAAQLAKMDHVCRKLALRPGERVIEAGCGWGALAVHMAERYGARVRAFNVSTEQVAWAREQVARRGLTGRVEVIEDDWRNVTGPCDAFASVGMLEHVGPAHYEELGRVIDRALTPQGRGLLHTIGRVRPMPMSPWLERRIFPGALIPAISEMTAVFEPAGLAVLDLENLRPHYARTLEHWLARFEEARGWIADRYDERLVRTYRLYLAAAMAAFRAGTAQLYQVLLARQANDAMPWTRQHLYDDAAWATLQETAAAVEPDAPAAVGGAAGSDPIPAASGASGASVGGART